MSGLAGIVRLDGRTVDPADMERMRSALAHRGPDGIRFWSEGPCGILCFRTGPDRPGDFPFVSDDAVLAVDSPGEIPAARMAAALTAGTFSPAEGNLQSFALASWDRRRKRLFLARDPVGVRPLYYAAQDGAVLFASEVKALLAVPWVKRAADPVRLEEFRRFRFRSADRTFFDGIFRLPAGGCLGADAGGFRRKVYWRPAPTPGPLPEDHGARVRLFRELFLDAVRARLPQSGPVAFLLSGGVDSSAVLAAADWIRRRERPGLRFLAVSMLSRRFPDEREHVRRALERVEADRAEIYFEDHDALDGLRERLSEQESPYYDVLDGYIFRMYGIARKWGARVVLSGDWGDETLTGCAYLADLFREGAWRELFREASAIRRQEPGFWPFALKSALWYLVLPNRVADRYEALRHLARRIFWPFRRAGAQGPRFPLASQRELYDGVFGPHNELVLECAERGAAWRGVEPRFPFLDLRLLSFLFAAPFRDRILGGVGKRILREALADLLPPTIAGRTDKGDYTDVLEDCLARAGFRGKTSRPHDDLWREKTLAVWEEIWLEKNGNLPIGNPALSSTAA